MNKELNISIIPKILFFWYITIFISTELLSYFNLINRNSIIFTNLAFLIFVYLLFGKELVYLVKQFRIKRHLYLYVILFFLILTLIQGFLSAPNTTDSIVRRLPIVMYWVQEQTLYQETIRNGHDFMGPFVEYIFLHLYLLTNSDRILFLSQWTAFVGVLTLTFLITKKIGASSMLARSATLLVASIPIVVMQAASVQTDMVTAVMVLYSVYFALLFINNSSFINCILLSFAIGLGILTKATFLLYIIIPFGLILPAITRYYKKLVLFGLISFLIIGIIQARFLEQNLRLYGGISGAGVLQGTSGYTNELIAPSITLSNTIKNIITQVPIPIGSELVFSWIQFIHNKIGVGINDSRTHFYDVRFSILPFIIPQEDIVSNPIHLILIFSAGFLLLINFKQMKTKGTAIYIYLLILASFIIFSTVLKWQPFHSRLLIPFFIIGAISSTVIIYDYEKMKGHLKFFLLVSTFLSFLLVIFNTSRPFISYHIFYPWIKNLVPPLSSIPNSIFVIDRDQHLFNARYYWHKPYKEIWHIAKNKEITGTVTFNLMDEFEYPMWYFMKENRLSLKVLPYVEKKKDTIIISTSKEPIYMMGYSTECIKTEIEYGYACLYIPQ